MPAGEPRRGVPRRVVGEEAPAGVGRSVAARASPLLSSLAARLMATGSGGVALDLLHVGLAVGSGAVSGAFRRGRRRPRGAAAPAAISAWADGTWAASPPTSSVAPMTELHDLTALEQGAAIRAGEVSTGELVEHYLERIDRLSDQLGAFVTVTAEEARSARPSGRRPAGRRTHRDQGPQRDQGRAHQLRVAGVRRLRARLRRRGRTADRGSGNGQPGQDEHAGVRLALLHRARGRAAGGDAVGHLADGGRLERRIGGGGLGGTGARRAGLRRRRLDPDPGELLRDRRAQADAGADLRGADVRRPGRPRDQRLARRAPSATPRRCST